MACTFCLEITKTTPALCGKCQLCDNCTVDCTNGIGLCDCDQLLVLADSPSTEDTGSTFGAIAKLLVDLSDLADTLTSNMEFIQHYRVAYVRHLTHLADQVAEHMPGHLTQTITQRYNTLLAEVTTKNAPKLKALNLHVENMVIYQQLVQRGIEQGAIAQTKSLTTMVAWYHKWLNKATEAETALNFDYHVDHELYRVYFYREMSPVNINTIGEVALPFSLYSKGVKDIHGTEVKYLVSNEAGDTHVTRYIGAKKCGRDQWISKADHTWEETWYDHDVKRWMLKRDTVYINVFTETIEYYHPNGQLSQVLCYQLSTRITRLFFDETGARQGVCLIAGVDRNDRSKSGWYENDRLVQTLDVMMVA